MRVVALLATYNERRFVDSCLEHLYEQGVSTYLIDNGSTDGTLEIAERHLGRGLLGVESFPRDGVYRWRPILERKEQLARELDADWFLHLDADEVRLAPPGAGTLAEALADVDRAGYNAVNFLEFTFIPTLESPDHDHRHYQRTLRTYYPFASTYPHQIKGWKATDELELAASAGHKVSFPGRWIYPQSFRMKHYLFLSVPHAVEKYLRRDYDSNEVESGWHRWRAGLNEGDLCLPSASQMRLAGSDANLDPSRPHKYHWVDGLWRDSAASVWESLPERVPQWSEDESIDSRCECLVAVLERASSPAAIVHVLAEVGITPADLAIAVRADSRTIESWYRDVRQQIRKRRHKRRVRELKEVVSSLVADGSIAGREAEWLRTSNRGVDFSTPLEAIGEGRWRDVVRIYRGEVEAGAPEILAADRTGG